MKITFVLSYYLPEKTTQHYLYAPLIKRLLEMGHEVNVLTPNPTRGLHQEEIKKYKKIKFEKLDGVNVYRVNAYTYNPKRFNKFKLLLRYLSVSFRLARKVRKIESDVIFTQTNPPIFLAYLISKYTKKKGIRLIYNVQDIYPDNIFALHSLLYRLVNPYQVKALSNASSVITISETMKETLLKKVNDPNKIKVIYNFSITEYKSKEKEEEVRNRLQIDKNKFNVIYAGNIGYVQDLDVLLRAAELTKDNSKLAYHIIGEGSQAERIKHKINDLNLHNVNFHPMQSVEDAAYIYHIADVNIISILPGVIRTALPLKVASCLDAQKELVFIGLEEGIHEKWQNENIIKINKRDYHHLANKLNELSGTHKEIVHYDTSLFNRELNIENYIKEIISN